MSAMALLTTGLTLVLSQSSSNRRHLKYLSSCFNLRYRVFSVQTKLHFVPHLFKPSTFRIKSFQREDAENYEGARSKNTPEEQDNVVDELLVNQENTTGGTGSSFLAKLAIVLGIAATVTILSVGFKQPNQGPSLGIQYLADGSSSSTVTAPDVGFTFKAFGYKFVLPEYAPGWIYFWLLMAAGFGLFISEEALNIWVGISLARRLTLDGTWQSFAESFSGNASYIISTILWVYWGVCISDMVPFYVGKLFTKSGASNDVCSKLGIGKDKAVSITRIVQRYGNLIGFGYISRVFLCWCLLWWGGYSSASVGDWVLIERASGLWSGNSCYCSGNLDSVPICCSCFNGAILLSPTALLRLVLLLAFCGFMSYPRMQGVCPAKYIILSGTINLLFSTILTTASSHCLLLGVLQKKVITETNLERCKNSVYSS